MSTSYKITDLTELAAVDVADADLLEIVDFDADSSKKVSIQSLKTVFTATPAGSDTEIQFNDGGSFGASSNLLFDGTNFISKKIINVGGNGVNGQVNFLRGSDSFQLGQIGTSGSIFKIVEQQGSGGSLETYDLGQALTWRRAAASDYRIAINNTSYALPNAQLEITTRVATTIGQIINLANGQTADAFQINSYGGSVLNWVGSDGVQYYQNQAITNQIVKVNDDGMFWSRTTDGTYNTWIKGTTRVAPGIEIYAAANIVLKPASGSYSYTFDGTGTFSAGTFQATSGIFKTSANDEMILTSDPPSGSTDGVTVNIGSRSSHADQAIMSWRKGTYGGGTGTEYARMRADGDFELTQDGMGVIAVSPDGLTTKRIGIDNSGNVVATAV